MKIDLSRSESWVAFAVTGVMAIPVFGLGLGPDMYLVPLKKDSVGESKEILTAIESSFQSFGIVDHTPLTLGLVKIILIPMRDVSEYGVKIGLMVADLALSVFNKKAFSARASLIDWHRREGTAVGVVIQKGSLLPLKPKSKAIGPAIAFDPGPDIWDAFLNQAITGTLPPLGVALQKCMDWEREAQQTAHVTHRFAFLWIGLEAMLPASERDGTGCGKRFSILTGSPAKYYAKLLFPSAEDRIRLSNFLNPESKKWRSVISDMYRCRCEIIHEGGTDLSSITIDPLKVDWYGLMAEILCTRLIGLAINALQDGVSDVDAFWEEFVPDFLYSDKNHWFQSGVFFQNHYINYDWKSGPYPQPFA